MVRRFAVAIATAAMVAALLGLGQQVYAVWIECGLFSWPFCGF